METVYKERKLLKKLISISKQFNNQNVKFTDFDIDDNDYYLNQLIQKRLIIKTGNQWDEHDRIIPDYYQVTDYGLHFFEERREETLQFIKKSILTPIAVSIITTGLMWIIGLLTGLIS